jgi:hypothetical protein
LQQIKRGRFENRRTKITIEKEIGKSKKIIKPIVYGFFLVLQVVVPLTASTNMKKKRRSTKYIYFLSS